MQRLRLPIAAAAFSLACSCDSGTTATSPGLSVTPVELGGDHAALLEASLGPQLAYTMRYSGKLTGYNVKVQTWSSGELIKTQSLAGGSCRSGNDMLVGLIMLEPRRDDAKTELTFAMQQGGSIYHRDIKLSEWDKLRNGNEGTAFVEWDGPSQIDVKANEPIVLWRLNRAEAVPLQSLPSEVRKDVDDVLQVTITFR